MLSDTCEDKYLDCNNAFATCTMGSCDIVYTGTDIGALMDRLGCRILAASFAWIVESEIGRFVFDLATGERCTCCPPDKPVSCASGCTNNMTDPNNCGACGNVCASGVCENGVCSESSCNGLVCGDYLNCGGGAGCVCFTSSDGSGFCAFGSMPCSSLPTCNTNADCAGGSICAVQNCCGYDVCIPAVCANPTRRLFRKAKRDVWVEPTPSQPGHWAGDV